MYSIIDEGNVFFMLAIQILIPRTEKIEWDKGMQHLVCYVQRDKMTDISFIMRDNYFPFKDSAVVRTG